MSSKINVHEATGEQLDCLAAMADGKVVSEGNPNTSAAGKLIVGGVVWNPATNGAQCMELIEEAQIWITPNTTYGHAGTWRAGVLDGGGLNAYGDTAKIAACRAFVISKLGEEVEL